MIFDYEWFSFDDEALGNRYNLREEIDAKSMKLPLINHARLFKADIRKLIPIPSPA